MNLIDDDIVSLPGIYDITEVEKATNDIVFDPTGEIAFPTTLEDEDLNFPETEEEAQEIVKKKTIYICLQLKKMGTKRKVSSSTDAIETDTDRNMLFINKLILDSPELEAVLAADTKARALVKSKALPVTTPLRGCYLLPIAAVNDLDAQLVEMKGERQELVNIYVAAYPTRMAEAESRLGKLFNPADYLEKERVQEAFAMDWSYPEPTNISGSLKEISSHIFNREFSKMGERCQMILTQVEDGLVDYMEGFIDKIVDSIKEVNDGNTKRLRAPAIHNFQSFLTQLPAANLTNNQKLAELGKKAAAIMQGADPGLLRKDRTVRDALQEKLQALKQVDLNPLVQDRPERKISFD